MITFASVPPAAQGDPSKLIAIGGRINHTHAGRQIVLYARTNGVWYVQPFVDQPFTKIRPDLTWRSSTHPGVEYAALLVDPGFRPPAKTHVLPTNGVIASAVVEGTPPLWQRWWFLAVSALLVLYGIYALYRYRMNQISETIKIRFEERLAERMRVARILHDTLLQGVISSSMQLHVAIEQLPADSPMHERLNRVSRSMGQVIEEGRNTLRGLSSAADGVHDLRNALSRIPEELDPDQDVSLHVNVKGLVMPLQPKVSLDLHRIAREAFLAAKRDSRAANVEMELRYTANDVRLRIRHDGRATDAGDLSNIREYARRMGATLKPGKKQTEVRVPSHLAFESIPQRRASRWFRRSHE